MERYTVIYCFCNNYGYFKGKSDDREFDQIQSNKSDGTDILAQAMELSSIPTDMNKNLDIVSQAMELSDISSDIMMDF